jgi:hypothetical protein
MQRPTRKARPQEMPYIGPDFPSLRDPNLACGILPGFPIRESYPIENQEELEKNF